MSDIIPILPELTKTYILDRISEEEIMEKYLGVAVTNDTLVANSVCSPLRKDNSPTCNYWYSRTGKLRFKDWSGHFHGDCFDVVAYKIQVNSRDSKAFQLVLHTIAKDFRIHKYKDYKEVEKYDEITKEFYKKLKTPSQTLIKVVPRTWNYHDDYYWGKFLVDRKTLEIGKVYPVEELYISKRGKPFIRIYSYSFKDLAYAYYGGKDNTGKPMWKIYFPLRNKRDKKNPRFLSSHSFLQGKHLIQPARFCIVTKAYKDVLAFRKFNIMAVAPSAEGVLLTKDEYWLLRKNFDFILSCMDYDRTGKLMAKQLKDIYGIEPIMFTDGYFNTYNYGSKDPAEYIHKNGYSNSMLLFQTVYKRYIDDIRKFDTYFYNNLKFIK